MKTIAKFLTLLLCFELIVAPIGTNIGVLNNHAYAQSCPTGLTYDATLNRCITSDQAAQIMQATQSCGGDMNCYMTNATAALQDQINSGAVSELKENKHDLQQWTKGVAIMTAIMMTFVIFRSGAQGYVCSAISYGLIAAAAVSMVVFDVIINKKHKNNLADIKKDWGNIVNPNNEGDLDKQRESSINAQSQSFEMLARSEESFAQAADSKHTLYWIVAGAYFAAAAVAGLELLMPQSANCPRWVVAKNGNQDFQNLTKDYHSKKGLFESYTSTNETPNFPNKQLDYNLKQSVNFSSLILNNKALSQTNSSPSVEEYEILHKSIGQDPEYDSSAFNFFKKIYIGISQGLNPIQLAHAEEKTNAAVAFEQDGKKFDDMTIEFIGMGLGLAAGILGFYVNTGGAYISNSIGRLVLGVILGTTTGILASDSADVRDSSTGRAEKLRQMKTEFDSGASSLYACKSEDREDPGKPNCYCYTPKNQRNSNRSNSQVCQNLWAGPSVGFKTNSFGSTTGKMCIDKNNRLDQNCACKKNGTCLKASAAGLKGVGPGTLTMLSNGLDPLNNLANGNSANGSLTAGSAEKSAMRMRELKNKILDMNGLKKFKGKIGKAEKDFTDSATKMASTNPIPNPLSNSNSSLPTNAKEAARMLEKELTPQVPTSVSGNQGTVATPSGKEEQIPDFGMSDSQAAQQESQVAEAMGKNLDYGGTDINNSSKANIFEVLTNRYQRSGMRRLFDENNSTQAEKPANTDVNK